MKHSQWLDFGLTLGDTTQSVFSVEVRLIQYGNTYQHGYYENNERNHSV